MIDLPACFCSNVLESRQCPLVSETSAAAGLLHQNALLFWGFLLKRGEEIKRSLKDGALESLGYVKS